MTAHRQRGQTPQRRTSRLQYGFAGTRFVVSPSKENPMKIIFAAAALLALALPLAGPAQAAITSQSWGGLDGKGVDLFTLTNAKGVEAKITNYGGVITSVRVPGKD